MRLRSGIDGVEGAKRVGTPPIYSTGIPASLADLCVRFEPSFGSDDVGVIFSERTEVITIEIPHLVCFERLVWLIDQSVALGMWLGGDRILFRGLGTHA